MSNMNPKLLATLILTLFNLVMCNAHREAVRPVVVELAIVCDKDFVTRFGNNETKIFEYWSKVMWEVDMKFKTLVYSNVEIPVVNITLIRNEENQPIVKDLSNENFLDLTADWFKDWLSRKEKDGLWLPFDVAILVSGAEVDHDITKGARLFHNSICTPLSSGTIIYKEAYEDYMSAHISHLVSDVIRYTDPKECNFWQNGDISRFFFPECYDVALHETLLQRDLDSSAECLFQRNPNFSNVLDSYSRAVPPALDAQCQASTGTVDSYAIHGRTRCILTYCQELSLVRLYRPLDNSPCERDSNCFRGRCLPQGFQFMNVYHKRCMHSTDRFADNDSLTAAECVPVPTPLYTLRIVPDDPLGHRLITPYTPAHTEMNLDKCVTVNQNFSVVYKTCKRSADEVWKMIRTQDTEVEFMLLHNTTSSWLTVGENNILVTSMTSNFKNSKFLWSIGNGRKMSNADFLGLSEQMSNLIEKTPSSFAESVGSSHEITKQKETASCKEKTWSWPQILCIYTATILLTIFMTTVVILYWQKVKKRTKSVKTPLKHRLSYTAVSTPADSSQ